jgi:dTDP-4-dehydrorhamnose reductase
MRIVVTGSKGQLAQSLIEQAAQYSWATVITVGRPELDLAIPRSIAPVLARARPDVIVNAAAYTAVDKAESEPDLAMLINRDGAAAVARTAETLGVPIIHISSDYVFNGDKPSPYVETDETGPLGAYGRAKLAGEAAVCSEHSSPIILRTAWVYSTYGANFVKTMLRLAKERDRLRVVDDQIGNPTSAADIADGILRVILQLGKTPRIFGTYHMSGSGETTWCRFARHIFALSKSLGGPVAQVEAIATADYPTPARRPRNSRLDNTLYGKVFEWRLPDWPESLGRCVARLIEEQ